MQCKVTIPYSVHIIVPYNEQCNTVTPHLDNQSVRNFTVGSLRLLKDGMTIDKMDFNVQMSINATVMYDFSVKYTILARL